MKNIAILETHFHVKFLYTMMRICKTKDTNVTVFTTKKIYSRIKIYLDKKSNYEIILKEDNESLSSFLKKVEKICNEKIDLLFVNTIQMSSINIPPYIRFRPKVKVILTIHIVNHWLKAKFAFGVRNIVRVIDTNISIFLIRKFILPKFDAINVIYPPVKDYIEKNTNYNKQVFTLPFNFYDKTKKVEKSKKESKIIFVLPGLIETYRRNYNLALNVFEKLFKKYDNKISLYLLGKPVGDGGSKIIKRCKEMKNKGFGISFSKGFIPEEEYDKISRECDFIISPLNVTTKRDTGIKEIYGKTEGSALPFEAIQYCKPLIVPIEFNILNEMKSSTLQYKSVDDLEKILIEIIENKEKLDNLKKEAIKNSGKFSLDSLQTYFKNEILDKLDIL